MIGVRNWINRILKIIFESFCQEMNGSVKEFWQKNQRVWEDLVKIISSLLWSKENKTLYYSLAIIDNIFEWFPNLWQDFYQNNGDRKIEDLSEVSRNEEIVNLLFSIAEKITVYENKEYSI